MNSPSMDEPAGVAVSSSPAPDKTSTGPILDSHFRKRFGGQSHEFVLEVEFQAAPGITILFGPSGAGKTTLLDCVAGLATPDAGRIAAGQRILFDANKSENVPVAKRGVGYVLKVAGA